MSESSPAAVGARPLDAGARAAILDDLSTALLVVGDDETIAYANPRAEELLGAALPLAGRAAAGVLAPMDRLREIAAAAVRDDSRASVTIQRDGEAPKEIGIQLSEIDFGQGPATLIVFQDISHFLRLQSERDHLLKLATVGEVLPSILHELKNPLASVTSAVELLVEEAPPGPFQNDLHAILTEVRRMKLGFEGIGIAGRALHSERHTAVDLALRHAVQVFHARAEQDGIELRCEVPDLPLLRLDDAVMRAIAFNLVNNALHACRRGDSVRVAAHLEAGGGRFALEVTDTGVGMSAETCARCTELFYTTKKSGSGIGLALCDSTLKAAGGELAIASELGAGTTMSARVPLETRP
ncbi:MAG: ATP-binding protein [Myxococcota bacterium]|nr:ATP-binding protein [Myxococcota bacterium]